MRVMKSPWATRVSPDPDKVCAFPVVRAPLNVAPVRVLFLEVWRSMLAEVRVLFIFDMENVWFGDD
jgi:hypothetical protein